MRKTILLLGGLLLAASPLTAQEPEDPARAGELRRMIEQRFTERVREDLGLSDQQAQRLRDVEANYFDKRRSMEAEERRIRRALAGELRPGVAADKDSVAKLTDRLLDNKVRYVQSYKDEVAELGSFLDPVQRAQFLILRERLLDRIRQAQQQRGQVPPRRLNP
jgi:Spy/CpxP family protein refolding chaperone